MILWLLLFWFTQSSLSRACGPGFCACERDRALQRRHSESIRIKQHKAGQRAAERHPSESECSEKRKSTKIHQWKETESRNSIQGRKACAESLWPGVLTALPPCPGHGWAWIVWLQQQRAELKELPVIPSSKPRPGDRHSSQPSHLKAAPLQQALSKHRALDVQGDAACRNRKPPVFQVRLTQSSSLHASVGKQIHCLWLLLEFRATEWKQGVDQCKCGLYTGKGCSFIKAARYHSQSCRCKEAKEKRSTDFFPLCSSSGDVGRG